MSDRSMSSLRLPSPLGYSVPMVVEQTSRGEMMAADTGQPVERVAHDINRDYWMSATEARDYGVIDTIVGQTDATAAADRAEAAVQQESSESPGDSTNGKSN